MSKRIPITDNQMSVQGKKDSSKVYVQDQGRPMLNMAPRASITNPVFFIIAITIITILIPVTIYHVSPGGDLMGGDNHGGTNGATVVESDDSAVSGDFDALLFARDNCASCHGSDLTGGMGPTLYGIDPDDFFTIVREGKDAMPAFGESVISDEDLTFMAEYFADASE